MFTLLKVIGFVSLLLFFVSLAETETLICEKRKIQLLISVQTKLATEESCGHDYLYSVPKSNLYHTTDFFYKHQPPIFW